MPSIWAPDGNVKINITTTAGLEGSKWHEENDAPKDKGSAWEQQYTR